MHHRNWITDLRFVFVVRLGVRIILVPQMPIETPDHEQVGISIQFAGIIIGVCDKIRDGIKTKADIF